MVEQRWALGGEPEGLAVSPDGRRLYAGLGGRVAVIDAGTGERLSEIGKVTGSVRRVVLAR